MRPTADRQSLQAESKTKFSVHGQSSRGDPVPTRSSRFWGHDAGRWVITPRQTGSRQSSKPHYKPNAGGKTRAA